MIRAAMPAAEYGDDYGTTLADAYFRGESWLIWEFERFDAYDRSGLSRTEVDDQMRLAQEKLMDQRNARWIAPIEGAAAEAAGAGQGLSSASARCTFRERTASGGCWNATAGRSGQSRSRGGRWLTSFGAKSANSGFPAAEVVQFDASCLMVLGRRGLDTRPRWSRHCRPRRAGRN